MQTSCVKILTETSYGTILVHKFDTVQTQPLIDTGKSISFKDIDVLRPYINKDTIFVDIGSNIGCFTLDYARLAKKVIAFEAQRLFANMLSGSVALNGMQNVWVHNKALSDCEETLNIPQFDVNKDLSWGSVEFGDIQLEQLSQCRLPNNPDDCVPAYALDTLIKTLPELNQIDVLKIDVEGMELKVLNGAASAISLFRPVLFIEHYKADKKALQDWFAFNKYNWKDFGTDYLALPT
jgi:FkbM family methyltransferase